MIYYIQKMTQMLIWSKKERNTLSQKIEHSALYCQNIKILISKVDHFVIIKLWTPLPNFHKQFQEKYGQNIMNQSKINLLLQGMDLSNKGVCYLYSKWRRNVGYRIIYVKNTTYYRIENSSWLFRIYEILFWIFLIDQHKNFIIMIVALLSKTKRSFTICIIFIKNSWNLRIEWNWKYFDVSHEINEPAALV